MPAGVGAGRGAAALDRRNLDRLKYTGTRISGYLNMSGWFENETLATFSLGNIFGMIICDLVFEIRPGLARRDTTLPEAITVACRPHRCP